MELFHKDSPSTVQLQVIRCYFNLDEFGGYEQNLHVSANHFQQIVIFIQLNVLWLRAPLLHSKCKDYHISICEKSLSCCKTYTLQIELALIILSNRSRGGFSWPDLRVQRYTGCFLFCVKSLIKSPAFISYSILFIDPSFSLGDKAQSNEVLIIIVSLLWVEK